MPELYDHILGDRCYAVRLMLGILGIPYDKKTVDYAAARTPRSTGALARLGQQLVLDGAELEWLPQENIFYPGALARVDTEVLLTRDSRFIGWERRPVFSGSP